MNDFINNLIDAIDQFEDELIEGLTPDNTVFEPIAHDHLELH